MKKNWVFGIIGLLLSFVITILVVYYLNPERRRMLTERLDNGQPDCEPEERIVIDDAVPCEPDDLTCIEGIGPKSSTAVQEAGITTYAQLADTDIEAVKDILQRAGVYVAVSDSWKSQADLAAAGEWDQLESLKAELKQGRNQGS